jgi:hypothetical protein
MSSRHLDSGAEIALTKIIELVYKNSGITINHSQAIEFLHKYWENHQKGLNDGN